MMAAVAAISLLTGCGSGDNAILIVEVQRSGHEQDATLVKNALKKGGVIKISGDTGCVEFLSKEVGPNVERYGAMGGDGKYFVMPAIMNWIADKGWRLQQVANNDYVFVKTAD